MTNLNALDKAVREVTTDEERGKADRMLWAYVWIIAPASEPATAR